MVTYKAMFIRNIVSQFEFIECNRLCHPLFTRGRAIRVNVHSFGHLRIGLSCNDPSRVVKFVSTVVCCNNIHQKYIFCFFVQAVHAHFKRRKHSPVNGTNRHRIMWLESNLFFGIFYLTFQII